LTAFATALARRSTITVGVAAGAIRPFQVTVRNPGKPDSATVGTSGNCRVRTSLDTAIARTVPPFACGSASDKFAKYIGTWPAMTSAIAGPPPL
jgi:hypothetical protein